jgi:O-antigen/teichoic acid export membrane protein
VAKPTKDESDKPVKSGAVNADGTKSGKPRSAKASTAKGGAAKSGGAKSTPTSRVAKGAGTKETTSKAKATTRKGAVAAAAAGQTTTVPNGSGTTPPSARASSGTPASSARSPRADDGVDADELVQQMVGTSSFVELRETLPIEPVVSAPNADAPGPPDGAESGTGSGPSSSGPTTLSKKIATSASQLFVRRIAVQLLSALSTAVLARKLGVSGFGGYAAGLAMYYLALSACDFGFGNVLGRELGRGRSDDGSLVRSMLRTQTVWSAVVGLIVVGFSVAVGLDIVRIQVLIVLAPAVALFGLSGVRQVFYANYKVAQLGALDVISNVAQALVVIAVALLGGGPLAIAVAMSAMIVLNIVVVLVAGLRLLDEGAANLEVSKRMLADALPLGISSLLASAYFTLDLSIVGFLVSSKQVAYYAAATKSLSLLVTVPGLVISAMLPGMASKVGDPSDLGKLVARAWHWLAAVALPLCMGVLLFAPFFVRIFYGKNFTPAIPLVRILALSGVAALVSNIFGAALIASRRTRWLIIEGSAALVFNVVGNLVLVPHFGVTASAWLTVATEVGVATSMAFGLRGIIEFKWAIRVTIVPVLAMGAMIGVWALTDRWVLPSIIVSGLAFFAVLIVLGGWPEEIPLPGARRFVLWRRP